MANFVSLRFSPIRLTGPILDKELRVSSRQRRSYALRFGYLAILAVFIFFVWIDRVPAFVASGLYATSRMAEAGKAIVSSIAWFQFSGIQLVAIVILSNAVSDEIYRRTLPLLVTTPITSLQIVLGKLSSRLLHLILLMCASLPLLAMVRVFGGVPWGYLVSSLCITLTAVIFVGSVSLLFSIFIRRAYIVVILTILTLTVLFGSTFLLAISFGLMSANISTNPALVVTCLLNPYAMLALTTEAMFNPRFGGIMADSWPVHCVYMLTASVFVLTLAVACVRSVALRQAAGQLGPFTRYLRRLEERPITDSQGEGPSRRMRHIIGPAMIWKELICPVSRHERIAAGTLVVIELILIAATYAFPPVIGIMGMEEALATYTLVFLFPPLLFTAIAPATCITSEKEARSWPLLLTTPLSGGEILLGKLAGILRRCLPFWFLYLAYIGAFCATGFYHVSALPRMVLLAAWVIVCLSGTGLYFSTRCRRTTTAVLWNLALAATIWGLLPLMVVLVTAVFAIDSGRYAASYLAIPFVQAMDFTSSSEALYLNYRFFGGRVSHSTLSATFSVWYILVGLLFAWRAKFNFRHNIF